MPPNLFRRIALAQGLLPEAAQPPAAQPAHDEERPSSDAEQPQDREGSAD